MKVLIAVSSKHGSTREIAESIADTIRDAGAEVEVVAADQVGSVEPYDAVVAGSAVFGGWTTTIARELTAVPGRT